jgi:hypothetical protein
MLTVAQLRRSQILPVHKEQIEYEKAWITAPE